jgi:hypothetical protein
MLAAPDPARERRDWSWLAACAVIVIATIPLTRSVTSALEERFGSEIFLVLTVTGLVALGAIALRSLRRSSLRPGASAWIVGTLVVLIAYSLSLQSNAIEALHLLEYAGISVLAFRALSHRTRDWTVYGSAVLLCGLLAALDEGVQWLTPKRVWDLRDIGFDTLAAAIAQLPIAFGVRPDWIEPRATRQGWRRFCRIGLILTVFLTSCMAATPPRLAALADRVPGFGSLRDHPDVMLEYGALHTLANGTRFRSRFGIEELVSVDRARAESAGQVLARWRDDDRYAEFLRVYTPIGDPFLHEMRVHLFRRDRYLETAERHREDRPKRFLHDRGIALREQEILEAGFANTMRAAGWDLSPRERMTLGGEDHPVDGYVSRVSESLITEWREAQVLALPAGLTVALLIGAWRSREPQR